MSSGMQALAGGAPESSVLGVEHLLRLFVRLPQVLCIPLCPMSSLTSKVLC